MARVKCSRCRRCFEDDVSTVEEVFGYKRPGVRFQLCVTCRVKRSEEQKPRYHNENRYRERQMAYSREYHKHNRDELYNKAQETIACKWCGREVCRDKMKHHQATRLCEKRRPPTES